MSETTDANKLTHCKCDSCGWVGEVVECQREEEKESYESFESYTVYYCPRCDSEDAIEDFFPTPEPAMSINCVTCIKNNRTGTDLLCDTCRQDNINRLAAAMNMINVLRQGEADSVEILCDNPEGDPNNAIVCNGSWTKWKPRRFEAETMTDCLIQAVDTKKAVEAADPDPGLPANFGGCRKP